MTERWAYQYEADEFDNAEHDPRGKPPSAVRFSKEAKSSLAVRFEATDIESLRQVAESRGMGVTQLVREWVLERLHERPEAERDEKSEGEPADTEPVVDLMEALEAALKAAKAVKRSQSHRAAS